MRKQAYAQAKTPMEEASLAFKRFILTETAAVEQSPEADLFRVNTLARMLDRFDDYAAHGADVASAVAYTKREFAGLTARMREEGFAAEGKETDARWPQLSEDEAAQYIKESCGQLNRRAIGVGMCCASLLPMMLLNALSELLYFNSDVAGLLGLCGMFGMIAMGVYAMVTAKKPEQEKRIGKRRFSLSARLRKKLTALKGAAQEKARRRKGRGIALLVACVLPIFLGAALDELWYTGTNDAFAMVGVGGMFAMIGAGVYELLVAGGEKKAVDRLLKE